MGHMYTWYYIYIYIYMYTMCNLFSQALVHKLSDMRTATIDIRLLAVELMFYAESLFPVVNDELVRLFC